jgi:hypothetical protein
MLMRMALWRYATFDKKGYRVIGFVVIVNIGCGCGVMVSSCVLVR